MITHNESTLFVKHSVTRHIKLDRIFKVLLVQDGILGMHVLQEVANGTGDERFVCHAFGRFDARVKAGGMYAIGPTLVRVA
jgi:hypothetical protein